MCYGSFFFFFSADRVSCLKVTIGGSFSPDAVQNVHPTHVKRVLSCPVVFTCLTVLVWGKSNVKDTSSILMMSSGPTEFSAISVSVNLWKLAFFFIVAGRCWQKVARALIDRPFLSHKSQRPRWSTYKIFNIPFRWRLFWLSVRSARWLRLSSQHSLLKNVFNFSHLLVLLLKAFIVFFSLSHVFTLPSPNVSPLTH